MVDLKGQYKKIKAAIKLTDLKYLHTVNASRHLNVQTFKPTPANYQNIKSGINTNFCISGLNRTILNFLNIQNNEVITTKALGA